jgi:hypothetical protein
MHQGISLAATLLLCLAVPDPVAGERRAQDRTASPAKSGAPRLDRYQVPAGAALLLKLRTPLDSASASVDDQVEATLWSPIIQDGVELIPVGSVAIGRVVEVVRASERTPLGAVTFAFFMVEHVDTGSRATVSTRKIMFSAAEPGAGRGKRRPRPIDAAMAAGAAFVATTSEPLLVRIPR